jgi:putative drug exporter of the RND superfamily
VRALAAWSIRHRVVVIVLWLAAVAAALGASSAMGGAFKDSFVLKGTESTHAYDLLKSAYPAASGDVEQIVFAVPAGARVTDAATRQAIEPMLSNVAALPFVASVASPYAPGGASKISDNGRIAYATVTLKDLGFDASTKEARQLVTTATAPAGSDLTIGVAGQVAAKVNGFKMSGTWVGIVLAGVVLLLVFGSIFAMALPLASALASLGTAAGIIGVLSHVFTMPVISTELMLLIGLGVGVDYALFIVTRHRQGLIAGRSVADSITTAVDTSGRAVLFAGLIVCVALLGMGALRISFLFGMAVAASIGVLLTMFAAITLIPALLSLIGHHVLSRRQQRRLKSVGPRVIGQDPRGFWARWSRWVSARPLVPALASLVIIGVLAAPFFTMRLGVSDQGNDPAGSTTRTAYDLLATGFGPGFNGQMLLVAQAPTPAEQVRVAEAVATLERQRASLGIAEVDPVHLLPGSDVMEATIKPADAPQSAATSELVTNLRSRVLPALTAGSGVRVLVGGSTAAFDDFSATLASRLPLFIAAVVIFSFLLLMVVFRSLVIPLTAALMNLLSIGAALGVVTAVFQHGIGSGLLGVGRVGPIEPYVPVMLFAIIFGLSMDYEVFLVTRIHEEWLRRRDNAEAVRAGLAATGKTITAAALIMILVFGSFILGGEKIIKEFGVGLGVGILVDAVVIRMAIVPALMQLLGRSNWYYPRWLERITPKVSVDVEEDLDDLEPPVEVASAP